MGTRSGWDLSACLGDDLVWVDERERGGGVGTFCMRLGLVVGLRWGISRGLHLEFLRRWVEDSF